jgi:hypothetical protein
MLMVGFVGRVRDCTVTGMLQAAGLAGEWHHSRAHDFFAYRCWDPDELGLRLLEFLVSVFVKTGTPIRLAVEAAQPPGRCRLRLYSTQLYGGVLRMTSRRMTGKPRKPR